MSERTAQNEPLTTGQRIVARWEGLNSGWSEPADLAEGIDEAIAAARSAALEEAAKVADTGMLVPPDGGSPTQDEIDVAERIAAAIRALKT